MLHGLAGVHVDAFGQDCGDVHPGSVAFQHAVGDEHQPVAHLQWKRLHAVTGSGDQPERAIGLQANLFAPPSPKPKRRGMAGVDDACRRTREVNPHEQAGNELTVVRVLG